MRQDMLDVKLPGDNNSFTMGPKGEVIPFYPDKSLAGIQVIEQELYNPREWKVRKEIAKEKNKIANLSGLSGNWYPDQTPATGKSNNVYGPYSGIVL
jgi:hypothetical protein